MKEWMQAESEGVDGKCGDVVSKREKAEQAYMASHADKQGGTDMQWCMGE